MVKATISTDGGATEHDIRSPDAQKAVNKFMAEALSRGIPEKHSDGSKAGVGHNSSGEVSGKRLAAFITRIERLNDEQKALGEDIRDIFAEAKSTGFCPKTMRKLIAERKKAADKRREEQELLALYASAIQFELF